MNILQLKTKPDPELIAFVELILDKVKNGDIIGLAAVSINRECEVGHGYSNIYHDYYRAVGGLEELKLRIQRDHSDY